MVRKRSRRPVTSLCGIGLVADIPDELILRGIEGDMQRQRQLDGAQVRREMAAAQRDRLDDLLAHLLRELVELCRRERLELRGTINRIQVLVTVLYASSKPPATTTRTASPRAPHGALSRSAPEVPRDHLAGTLPPHVISSRGMSPSL